MADEIVSDQSKKDKPAYDEQTLARVLEAAYVLQEHHRQVLEREQQERELGGNADAPREKPLPIPPQTQIASPRSEPGPARDGYSTILAQIVETQHQIQMRQLSLEPALALIVERVFEVTRAAGAAIGILEGRILRYRAVAGRMTLSVGSEVALEKALCAASLRVGDIIRCVDVNPDFLIDAKECNRRGIQSLIAVPIYQSGKIAGGLEVYYPNTHAFNEPDVHTCQLMAGLITEALGRNEELSWKNSAATERAVMLEALEKLKPNLAALAVPPPPPAPPAPKETPAAIATTASPVSDTYLCRKCGHELVREEQFCGQCGTPRSGDYEAPTMQSKVASMLYMQEAARKTANGLPANGSFAPSELPNASAPAGFERVLPDTEEGAADDDLPELFHLPPVPINKSAETDSTRTAPIPIAVSSTESETHAHLIVPSDAENEEEEDIDEFEDELRDGQEETHEETALAVRPPEPSNWSSAASARRFLEQLAEGKRSETVARFLAARRGYIYLILAIILVLLVIRWGVGGDHEAGAAGKPGTTTAAHRRPDADLPLFDRILISIGLADPPDAPEYKGNPDARVWIDLRSGLYYCPGADLYGKTPTGKYSTQRDAQLDQFEPAYRKPCD